MLQQAGFEHIEVKTEQFGVYRSLNEQLITWNGSGFYPRGNLLLQRSQEELEQLQTEYKAEVERLVTDKGAWYDITTFFVTARK